MVADGIVWCNCGVDAADGDAIANGDAMAAHFGFVAELSSFLLLLLNQSHFPQFHSDLPSCYRPNSEWLLCPTAEEPSFCILEGWSS